MTYDEKKFLYESIMKDIAKSVKKKINEAGVVDANLLMKKNDDPVLKQNLQNFAKTVLMADSIPAIKSTSTIVSLLSKAIISDDDKILEDIAKLLQVHFAK
jgi:hypothetical protein